MTPKKIILAFVDRINAQDVGGLCDLMTEDHIFYDALDATGVGREHQRKGWRWYFDMVPDYWIKVDRMFFDGNVVGLFGRAGGTYTSDGTLKPENKWDIPASWLGIVKDNLVSEWRVYADNEPVRKIIIREKGQESI